MKHTKRRSGFKFDLSGGALCLDFANTVSKRKIPAEACDHLATYSDLLAFATQSLYVPAKLARNLTVASDDDPAAAAKVLERAHKLREAIYRTFRDCVDGRPAPPADLKLIQAATIEGWKHSSLAKMGRRYGWLMKRDGATQFGALLWPVAHSAADLLTSERLKKVRTCEAETCAWLFLDLSRNHSRRWCDMQVCGNREKARRHYRRQRI